MTQTLFACPFCGSSDVRLFNWLEAFWMRCHGCRTQGPVGHNEAKAAELWNTRPCTLAAPPDELPAGESVEDPGARLTKERDEARTALEMQAEEAAEVQSQLRAEVERLRSTCCDLWAGTVSMATAVLAAERPVMTNLYKQQDEVRTALVAEAEEGTEAQGQLREKAQRLHDLRAWEASDPANERLRTIEMAAKAWQAYVSRLVAQHGIGGSFTFVEVGWILKNTLNGMKPGGETE